MKFKNDVKYKGEISKIILKKGIELDKGKFDGLQKGEERIISKDEIIGKFADGKCYVKMMTGWVRFIQTASDGEKNE